MVRLSAGREDMSEETQALCFLAGRQFDFLWAEASDHAKSGARPRSGADGAAGPIGDAGMKSAAGPGRYFAAPIKWSGSQVAIWGKKHSSTIASIMQNT